MLIIKVEKGNIEKSLKQMRRKFVKTQAMKDLRNKRYYNKPSQKRREQLEKAVKLSKWKIDNDED